MLTNQRVIAGKSYITRYTYNKANRVATMTYPSGRIVTIARNSLGQATGVTTKQTSTATAVNVATAMTYAPMSNLLKTMTHGNGLITSAGYDLDYRLSSPWFSLT